MRRHTPRPNAFFQMQDIALSRVTASTRDCVQRTMTLQVLDGSAPPQVDDLRALAGWLEAGAAELVRAWSAARERGRALKQLKRVDRRMLVDIGISRAQLREVVDAMNAVKTRDARKQADSAAAPTSAWATGNAAV